MYNFLKFDEFFLEKNLNSVLSDANVYFGKPRSGSIIVEKKHRRNLNPCREYKIPPRLII